MKPSKLIALANAINQAGHASRRKAEALVGQGRVTVNGERVRDPSTPVSPTDRIEIEGQLLVAVPKVYLMCHKPRGLVTTADDTEGRETVYACLEGLDLPHVGPVGRLDMASEGLLLFTNDTRWASALLDPARRVPKTYHVQIDGLLTEDGVARMKSGIDDEGERLRAISVRALPGEARPPWIEIVLNEGKNREIRRMLKALGIGVHRLVRKSIGSVVLGDLAVGAVRALTTEEVQSLRQGPGKAPSGRPSGARGRRRF